MSVDYLTLGSTPSDEPCAQVGSENYRVCCLMEGQAFKQQLLRSNPDLEQKENEGIITLRLKGFPHDFGTYHELCVIYDEDNQDSIRTAHQIDEDLPENWDSQAIEYLASQQHNGKNYFELMGIPVPSNFEPSK
jgi:hypothetical protein